MNQIKLILAAALALGCSQTTPNFTPDEATCLKHAEIRAEVQGVIENDEEKAKLAFVQGSIDAKRAGLLKARGG